MLKNRYIFNWNLALPLIILFIATAVSLCINLNIVPETTQQITGINLGWLWSVYNLIMIGITLLILLDAPKADMYEWFDLRRIVQLRVGDQNLWGVTTMISEAGAEIALSQKLPANLSAYQPIDIEIIEESLYLTGEVVSTGFKDEFFTVRVRFESVTLNQHRRLVEMLFCRPGQWKRQNAPGELYSLLLLLKIFLKPRILFDKKVDVSAMKVSQI